MAPQTRLRRLVERWCPRLGHPRMSWYERSGTAEEGPVTFIARSCPCGAMLDISTLSRELVASPPPLRHWDGSGEA